MSFVQKLMEAPNLMNIEQIAGMDEDGNIIVVGEGWAYISETGMMMSEYLADGSLREETSRCLWSDFYSPVFRLLNNIPNIQSHSSNTKTTTKPVGAPSA